MASEINDTVTEIEMEAIKKDLLRKSTKGEWDGVIDIYQKHPSAHKAKLTWNEDTALHIAVSDNKQEKVVGRLMDIISCYHGEGKDQAHEFKNKRGNTPLHVAASLGTVTMCESIARSFPLGLSFMAARNCKGETPLFLAALSGKKDALVSLHELCQDKNLNGYDFSRRTDDYDTILHVAISTECFDMALEIIELYPKLVHSTNRKGLSPLHLLAGKPSAFKCATRSEDNYKRSKKNGGQTEDLENPQIRSFPRQDQHRGYLRDKLKCKLAVEVMNKLLDQDGEADPNMIIGPEMVGDPKQKSPTDGRTSGLGCLTDKQKLKLAAEIMNDLSECISSYELDQDASETDPNMIIGPEMVGDQKQKSPTDGSTSGLGYLRDKQKRKLTAKVVNKLSERISAYELDQDGEMDPKVIIGPVMVGDQKQKSPTDGSTTGLVSMAREAPILIASKNGITQMVEKILEISPEAVYEVDSDMKNIVLLSVEHKQPDIYELLLDKKKKNIIHDSVFWEVDNDGNSALHLAAKVANSNPWPVSGPAFQMNWEIKWFEYVRKSMPESYPFLCNKVGETPREVFTKSHEKLVEEGRKWLIDFSKLACPVATGVFVTAAFSTSSEPDIQINETNWRKQFKLRHYSVGSITYSISFCLSTTAVLLFLLIISSPYSERSFRRGNTVITAFLFGLAVFYLSVIFTVYSFISGHFSPSDPETASSLRTSATGMIPMFTLVIMIPFMMYARLLYAYWRAMPHRKETVFLVSLLLTGEGSNR